MVARGTKVPRVCKRRRRHAMLSRLLYHDVHDARSLVQPQATVAVVGRGNIRFTDHAHVRPRIDVLRLIALHVHPQHVGNAMRINTVKVGIDQHIGRQVGILVR